MKRLVLGLLALAASATVAMGAAAPPIWFVETETDWCAYRNRTAFEAAVQVEGVLSTAEVTRSAPADLSIVAEAYSQAGDWRLTDRYRFGQQEASMSRNAVLLSTVARLDAEYQLTGGKVVRTRFLHRHLENDGPPVDPWIPEISIKTAPSQFAFWPLVNAMEADPSKAKACRKA